MMKSFLLTTVKYEVFVPIVLFFGLVSAGTILILGVIGLFQKDKKGKYKSFVIAIIFASVLALIVASMITCDIKVSAENNEIPKWLGLLYIAIELFVVGVYIAIEHKNGLKE